MQFLSTIFDSQTVSGVDDPDECISLLEVVTPVGTECFLAADIPNVELVSERR